MFFNFSWFLDIQNADSMVQCSINKTLINTKLKLIVREGEMVCTLNNEWLEFLKLHIRIFGLEFAFRDNHSARAKIIDKRYRLPKSYWVCGGMGGAWLREVKQAWLVKIHVAGRETEMEVSEDFFRLTRKGNNLLVSYKESWIDQTDIKVKMLG